MIIGFNRLHPSKMYFYIKTLVEVLLERQLNLDIMIAHKRCRVAKRYKCSLWIFNGAIFHRKYTTKKFIVCEKLLYYTLKNLEVLYSIYILNVHRKLYRLTLVWECWLCIQVTRISQQNMKYFICLTIHLFSLVFSSYLLC